jgi:hypothetical protein
MPDGLLTCTSHGAELRAGEGIETCDRKRICPCRRLIMHLTNSRTKITEAVF